MSARGLYEQIREQLAGAGIGDAGFEVDLLIRHVCGKSRLELEGVSAEQEAELLALSARRAEREPLQYLLGSWPFLELELLVGPGVLIPRPETEELCLAASALVRETPFPIIADLCSGSGALALGLQSLLPEAMVTAVEGHEEAFEYLLKNAEAFEQEREEAPVTVLADVFEWHRQVKDDTFDLIVCNPPYVTEREYESLEPELFAEPREALVPADEAGAADGLSFYRAIAREYRNKLAAGGWLVFEIGAQQGAAVQSLLEENNYDAIEIRKDMAGHDRIALACRPAE